MSDGIFFDELVPVAGRSADPLHDVAIEPREAFAARPWVYSNMITSLDGAVAVEGLSGGLGSPADQTMFAALRAIADVILVGASTAIDEDYRAPSDRHRAARTSRGQAARPSLAIFTRTLSIDPEHRVFSDPAARPIIVTTSTAAADRRRALSHVADIVEAGDHDLDLGTALGHLRQRGHHRALLEGGPRVNPAFVAGDLIDEWNLSLSPTLLASDSPRAASGDANAHHRPMHLRRLWLANDMLFGRWVRSDRVSR